MGVELVAPFLGGGVGLGLRFDLGGSFDSSFARETGGRGRRCGGRACGGRTGNGRGRREELGDGR
jgi:hypothetical protein